MNIVKEYTENGVFNCHFDDDSWVGITPSTQSWEYLDGYDDYMSGGYLVDGNTVYEYDGCYELPTQVILALSAKGYDIDL